MLIFAHLIYWQAKKVNKRKKLFAIRIINNSDETKLFCLLPKIGLGLQYYIVHIHTITLE